MTDIRELVERALTDAADTFRDMALAARILGRDPRAAELAETGTRERLAEIVAVLSAQPLDGVRVPRVLDEGFAKAIMVQHTLDAQDWALATEAWEHIIAEADKRACPNAAAGSGGEEK